VQLTHTSVLDVLQTMVQLPGVDVNAANAQGWTALHVAASLGHEGRQQQQQQRKGCVL
jgi:ankyrin repeat protein